MACFMVAVVTARLETTFGTELLKSELGLQTLAQSLAAAMGGAVSITRQTVNGAEQVLLRGPQLTVIVTASGLSAQSGYLSRAAIEEVLRKARELGEALAVPLAQERVVEAAKGHYGRLAVLSDTRQGAARVTRIRIPL